MKKIPYLTVCAIVGAGCLARIWHPVLFIWLGVIIFAGTGIFYAVSVLRKDTVFFHTYIGWSWIVLPIVFAHGFMLDPYSSWNHWTLIACGVCIAVVIVLLWLKDVNTELNEFNLLIHGLAIFVLTLAIAFCPKAINSSKATDIEFKEIEVLNKYTMDAPYSWEGYTYHLSLGYEDDLIKSEGFTISKSYFDLINVGDEIPVCIYTGILGKEFFYFFEDPVNDYYGLNEWTRQQYSIYQNGNVE